MPKLKSHSGTSKRIRITKTGKVLRHRAGTSHFMQKKQASTKRDIGVARQVVHGRKRKVKRALGV